jgi:thiamine biosynthesis protein ThiC
MSAASELKLYTIRRRSGWDSPEELQAAAVRSRAVGDNEMSDDIRWIRSYVVKEPDGKLGTVCIYQASSPEKIREHAARAGIPAHDVLEVAETVFVRPDPELVAA